MEDMAYLEIIHHISNQPARHSNNSRNEKGFCLPHICNGFCRNEYDYTEYLHRIYSGLAYTLG